jgi:hypothetical protein
MPENGKNPAAIMSLVREYALTRIMENASVPTKNQRKNPAVVAMHQRYRDDSARLESEIAAALAVLTSSVQEAGADPMPVFVIQAKDELAVSAVSAYRRLCEARGLDGQAVQVQLAAAEMTGWRERHPDAVKIPDHPHIPVLSGPWREQVEPADSTRS